MNIKISELYTKCEDMAKAIGLSVNDRFVFDLQDDTSLDSIKNTFKGIDKILLPGYGRYMVLMVSNEKPNVLLAVFPETEEFNLKLVLFNVKNQKSLVVGDKPTGDEDAMTLDNFEDVLSTDDVEKDVNDFLFSDEDEDEEEDDKGDDEKKDDEEKSDKEDDKEDEVIEPGKEEDGDKGEEGDAEPKDDEDKNPADLGDGEPADVEAAEEPETDDEPTEVVDDEEGEEDDDDVIDVVDDDADDEQVDEDAGIATQGDGTPADVGDNADHEIVVSEDADPADVGTGADEDKPAKAEGVAGEGDGSPAAVGTGADADKPAKEEGVTGEGDGKPADVGEDADKEVVKEGTAPVDAAPLDPAPAPAPADTTPPVDAAAPVADTVTDPEKDIRALIKFYTDELARKTADETVSTEVVSGIQAIIAGLVKNLEAMTDLEDTETEEAKAAAKAAKDEKKPEGGAEEVSEDGVPPAIETNPTVGAVADDGGPAAKVGGEAGVPVDQNVTLSTANMTPDLLTVQPDADTAAFDAATSADLVSVPGDPMNDLADVELPPAEEEPAQFDATVEIPDISNAVSITTDAPVDVTTGEPKETPAAADAAVDALPSEEPPMFGADGLPSQDLDQPSDKFIDDQIASLGASADTEADPDAVNFVPGSNTINWSDSLYDTGAANAKDNAETVPSALKELKEYAERIEKTVTECGDACNEVTIGRINKFCNLCATAYDTWHKIQDAMNASNKLRETMECNLNKTEMEKMGEETQDMAGAANDFDALEEQSVLKESAEDFARVQDYIKSIKHLL